MPTLDISSIKTHGVTFGGSFNIRRNVDGGGGGLLFETQNTARITLNYDGTAAFSGEVTASAGLFIPAGQNLLIGSNTDSTSGEGILTLYEASEVGTSAGSAGDHVNLFGVSAANEGGAATVLGYTTSVGTVTISNNAIGGAMSDTLTGIPINFNGTPMWIVASTSSA